jgi:hypothetical protein
MVDFISRVNAVRKLDNVLVLKPHRQRRRRLTTLKEALSWIIKFEYYFIPEDALAIKS